MRDQHKLEPLANEENGIFLLNDEKLEKIFKMLNSAPPEMEILDGDFDEVDKIYKNNLKILLKYLCYREGAADCGDFCSTTTFNEIFREAFSDIFGDAIRGIVIGSAQLANFTDDEVRRLVYDGADDFCANGLAGYEYDIIIDRAEKYNSRFKEENKEKEEERRNVFY